jgi:hypothetical protein
MATSMETRIILGAYRKILLQALVWVWLLAACWHFWHDKAVAHENHIMLGLFGTAFAVMLVLCVVQLARPCRLVLTAQGFFYGGGLSLSGLGHDWADIASIDEWPLARGGSFVAFTFVAPCDGATHGIVPGRWPMPAAELVAIMRSYHQAT